MMSPPMLGGYKLFNEVKTRGGHFINDTIAGVGFTQVGNGAAPGSFPLS